MSKALDIANNLSEFDGLTPAIDLSDVTATNITGTNVTGTNVTPTNLNIASTHHTFTVKGIDETVGTDTQSGQFSIYNGATKLWGINESGWVVNPNVPHFVASWNYVEIQLNDEYLNSDGSKNGWTARLNPQNDFNATDGIYTAPISGTYFFTFHDNMYRTAAGNYYIDWHKNNAAIGYSRMFGYAPATTWQILSGTLMCSLSAGDTMRLRAYSSVRLDGGVYGTFTGQLVG